MRAPGHADGVTRVRLANPAAAAEQVARIAYYTAATGFLRVSTPGGEVSLPLRTGLNVADLVVDGPLEEVELRLETSPPTHRRTRRSAWWPSSSGTRRPAES